MNDDELRLRAYYMWEAAGRPDGDPDRHWAQARGDAGLIDEAREEIVADRLADVLSPENRAVLEQQILPNYLARRRWFATKNQAIRSLKLADPAAIDEFAVLAQIEVALDAALNATPCRWRFHGTVTLAVTPSVLRCVTWPSWRCLATGAVAF
ncbi:hypothetical protein AWB77_04571 [Caballeronia fortuita]|uniref:DUF2934 domain-containing protein n=1 Tax=Caballeronia fortuita TaxID=1777138 RepID=A0A158CV17_9BURK|nr:DUF2934 domain-containing protein [Caballeronia fortuita]SAK86129.1 hypothetical protein AWB77_04571 [Caballeronia fortuita]